LDRAEFLKRAGAGAAGLALAAAAPGRIGTTARADNPNVLLIMTDDQPYHTIGVMESLQNRLVAPGVRFDNGYVATPVCGPARGSVLTGRWSHNTGLEGTNGAWRDLVDSGELSLTGVAPGVVFFGEVLGTEKIVGGAVTLVGVYLARRQ
jgi:hypothetical protein